MWDGLLEIIYTFIEALRCECWAELIENTVGSADTIEAQLDDVTIMRLNNHTI